MAERLAARLPPGDVKPAADVVTGNSTDQHANTIQEQSMSKVHRAVKQYLGTGVDVGEARS